MKEKCGIEQYIHEQWNLKCKTCVEHPDCRWHSYFPDHESPKCSFTSCDWGMGLAGNGWCSGGGNCWDNNCSKLTTKYSKEILK